MDAKEVEVKLKEIIFSVLDVPPFEIDPSINLRENYDIESFDLVCILLEIETSLKVKISPREAGEMSTFNDFYSLVKSKI